jgi:hypothetical protein
MQLGHLSKYCDDDTEPLQVRPRLGCASGEINYVVTNVVANALQTRCKRPNGRFQPNGFQWSKHQTVRQNNTPTSRRWYAVGERQGMGGGGRVSHIG